MSETIDIELNPDDLTLGDLEDFQGYVGVELHEAVKPKPVFDDEGKRTFDEKGRPVMETQISSKALVALVWLVRRADFPDFTVTDARNIKVGLLVIHDGETADRGND